MPDCLNCKRKGYDVGFSNSDALATHEKLMHADTIPVDVLIHDWSLALQAIYNNRTAGDHTFTGVLSEFARQLLRQGK